MRNVSFSWDDRKAEQNARKHQVSFEEATKNETKAYPWTKL